MYILFDIGGTKMRVAGTRDLKTFGEVHKRETPEDFYEGMDVFEDMVKSIAGEEAVTGAAGGIAGPLTEDRTRLVAAPNVGWADSPVGEEMAKRLDAPVFLENDAAVIGVGEAHYGSGQAYDTFVYLTVSTGVGGAYITNGRFDTSYGSEPGHQYIDIRDGVPQTLENLIGGWALEERTGMPPKDINDDAVWKEEARLLAYGLNNIAVMWSPQAIVLGGSMIFKRPGIHREDVQAELEDTMTIPALMPEIVQAELEDNGGLYGAIELLRQKGYA